MKAPKIISEKDQTAISELIEKFMPDDDKPLESVEIIKHLGDTLSEDAGENALIEHLSKNSEKKFTRDEMKVLSGKFGVEKYKPNYEASENTERKERDEAESIDRFMNGPSGDFGVSSKPIPVEKRISNLSQENKVIFENIKKEWLKKNKDKFKGMDEKELEAIADKIIIEALESSIEQSKKANLAPDSRGNFSSNQPMHSEMMAPSIAQPMTQGSVTGNALMGIAREAFKIAFDATAAITGGAAGALQGVAKGLMKDRGEVGLTISPEDQEHDSENTPHRANEKATYAEQMVASSSNNILSSVGELREKLEEVRELKKEGKWASHDSVNNTNSKLKSIDENMNEINDLKNILNSDLQREGVDSHTKMDGIKTMDEVKKSMKEAKETLGNAPSEKEIKQKADKIMKAIDRMIKAIKNLFSKDKDKNDPEKTMDEGASLSM